MVKWTNKYVIEVNLPLKAAWNFYSDPNNWSRWEDDYLTFLLLGEFKAGAIIKAKLKNKPTLSSIFITEVKPYQEYKTLHNVSFSSQERLYTFQEISMEKTRIILDVYIFSLFTTIATPTFLKKMEDSCLKYRQSYEDIAEKKIDNCFI